MAAASDQFDFDMWKLIRLEISCPSAPPTSAGVM